MHPRRLLLVSPKCEYTFASLYRPQATRICNPPRPLSPLPNKAIQPLRLICMLHLQVGTVQWAASCTSILRMRTTTVISLWVYRNLETNYRRDQPSRFANLLSSIPFSARSPMVPNSSSTGGGERKHNSRLD